LMIVVVIIGILASFAMPSWTEYQRKAARSMAKSAMLDMAQRQERYFTNRNTYLAVSAPPAAAASGFENFAGSDVNSRKFDITVAGADLTTAFTITATASNGHVDPKCGTMTLTSTGVKAPASGCW